MSNTRGRARRVALTALAYGFSLWLVAVAAVFAVLALAGPHGGMLPRPLHGPFLLLAWVAVLLLPALAARRVWRRLG